MSGGWDKIEYNAVPGCWVSFWNARNTHQRDYSHSPTRQKAQPGRVAWLPSNKFYPVFWIDIPTFDSWLLLLLLDARDRIVQLTKKEWMEEATKHSFGWRLYFQTNTTMDMVVLGLVILSLGNFPPLLPSFYFFAIFIHPPIHPFLLTSKGERGWECCCTLQQLLFCADETCYGYVIQQNNADATVYKTHLER